MFTLTINYSFGPNTSVASSNLFSEKHFKKSVWTMEVMAMEERGGMMIWEEAMEWGWVWEDMIMDTTSHPEIEFSQER